MITALEDTVLAPRAVTQANRSPLIRLPRHLDAQRGKCPLVSLSCLDRHYIEIFNIMMNMDFQSIPDQVAPLQILGGP